MPRILMRLQARAISGAEPDEYELGKLENALKETEFPKLHTIEITTGTQEQDPVIAEVTPTTITSAAAKSLHKLHGHVHAQMTMATTNEERADLARQIMVEIVPKLDAEYDRLRGNDKEETPDTADQQSDTTPLFRKLQSLRARISRLKNEIIPAATGARLAKYQQELEEKTAKKEAIELQL